MIELTREEALKMLMSISQIEGACWTINSLECIDGEIEYISKTLAEKLKSNGDEKC